MLNKKIASVMLSTIIAASFATAANADTRVAQATATWQATAKSHKIIIITIILLIIFYKKHN
ncbi:hypothetical protein [Proteus mirabilis]|uniref:hypothetical protein n=1 Tax=Proteus mirabilis TaxID=584 RepID=UPI0015C54199|nr:hypothetical protein [Proteus mirabilis]